MSQHAQIKRTDPAEFAKLPAEIVSRISVEIEPATARSEIVAAIEAALADAGVVGLLSVGDDLLVATHWEPPFKALRIVSAAFPAARLTVKSDAFRKEYWISRAVFENGKQTVEEVLTMNDGAAFESLFKEINGVSFADWKKENKLGAVRGGFAWGTAEGFDASKSELGKAEGQA